MKPVVAALAFLLAGCGSNHATVTGTVQWKDQPLSGGSVTFVDSAGKGKSFPIDKDGKYKATDLVPGKYRLAVVTPKLSTPVVLPGDKGKATPTPTVIVDAIYGSADTSGISYELKVGIQEINVSLPLKK